MTTNATTPDLRLWATPDALPVTSLTPGDHFGGGALFAIQIGIQSGVFPVVPDAITNATEAVTKIEAARSRYLASDIDLPSFVAQHANRVMAGGDIGDDFPDVIHDYLWAERNREGAISLIEQMRAQVQLRQPKVVADAVPAMLDGLRLALDALLAQARKVRTVLGGLDVTDAQAAATATDEQRAVFPDLPDLVARYWQIRNAQRVLYVATQQPTPGNSANSLRWTWTEYFRQQPHWEFRTGIALDAAPGKAAQIQRLMDVAAMAPEIAWIPTYDQLIDAFNEFWSSANPEPLAAPNLPDLKPGQHQYLAIR